MHEMNENQVEQQEVAPEEIDILEEISQETVYTPRPRWQRIGAAVLAVIMIIGVIGYYYWIMHKY